MFNIMSHDKENEAGGWMGREGDRYGPLDNLEDAAEMWDRKIHHKQTLHNLSWSTILK